jgi:hypothetical protein
VDISRVNCSHHPTYNPFDDVDDAKMCAAKPSTKVSMMRSLFLLATFLTLSEVDSFALPTPQRTKHPSTHPFFYQGEKICNEETSHTMTTLHAAKKPPEYGKGALDPLRWISPLNPYMLFVYMFGFILVVPVLKDAGIL